MLLLCGTQDWDSAVVLMMLKIMIGFSLILSCSKPVDPARLIEALPTPGKNPDTPLTVAAAGSEEVKLLTNAPHNDKDSNPPVIPILIPPRILPQLKEMAQRLVAAGHHQQCLKIYR